MEPYAFKVGDKVIDSRDKILTIVRETKIYWVLDNKQKVCKKNGRFVGGSIWHSNWINHWTQEKEDKIKEDNHRDDLRCKIRILADSLSKDCSLDYLIRIYNAFFAYNNEGECN